MKDKWIPVSVRVPDTRRPVLAWGVVSLMYGPMKPDFLGSTRFNSSKSGGSWGIEQSGMFYTIVVTHWQEIEGPDEANSTC